MPEVRFGCRSPAILFDVVQPGQNPFDVAVQHSGALAEGDAEDRTDSVSSDARKTRESFALGGKLAAVQLDDDLSRFM